MSQNQLRSKVTQLYKRFIYLVREYPENPEKMRQKVHDEFMRNRNVTDPKDIKRLIYKGEYMCKEFEALYSLKKYRAMKNRYYNDETPK